MKTLTSSPVVPEWWTQPEYTGDMVLPGQSRLDAEGRALLESIASQADAAQLEIPAMPRAAMTVVKLTQTAETELSELVDAVETDPAIAASVLKHANSALYGMRHPVDSIGQAVQYLGMQKLRTLLLEVSVKLASTSISQRAWSTLEWEHSIASAAISRSIGARFGLNEELCYLAGLLHDIGRLPVLMALDARGVLPATPVADSNVDVILNTLRRGVGMEVARHWELPPAIADAIANHMAGRASDEEPEGRFPSTTASEAAADLCIAMGVGSFRRSFDVLGARSLADVGFNENTLTAFLSTELPDVLERVADIV